MNKIAYVLVLIGALNWGLYALNFDLVDLLFGSWPMVAKVVYLLVGLSALWLIVLKLKGKKSSPVSNSGM